LIEPGIAIVAMGHVRVRIAFDPLRARKRNHQLNKELQALAARLFSGMGVALFHRLT
jgi:hypothetical protein